MRCAVSLALITVACGNGWEAANHSQANAAAFTPTAFSAEVRGHGRPIILIPGLGCPGAVWSVVTARLDGYQTHVLTLAGFAGQPAIDRPLVASARDELARYIRARGLD